MHTCNTSIYRIVFAACRAQADDQAKTTRCKTDRQAASEFSIVTLAHVSKIGRSAPAAAGASRFAYWPPRKRRLLSYIGGRAVVPLAIGRAVPCRRRAITDRRPATGSLRAHRIASHLLSALNGRRQVVGTRCHQPVAIHRTTIHMDGLRSYRGELCRAGGARSDQPQLVQLVLIDLVGLL